jgi:hypothetical protein
LIGSLRILYRKRIFSLLSAYIESLCITFEAIVIRFLKRNKDVKRNYRVDRQRIYKYKLLKYDKMKLPDKPRKKKSMSLKIKKFFLVHVIAILKQRLL